MLQLLSTDPMERGISYSHRHQWKRARECFEQATILNPADPLAWYRLAVTLDGMSNEAEAVPAYKRALRLGLEGQRMANAWAWLGSSLRKTNALAEALACFDHARLAGYTPEHHL